MDTLFNRTVWSALTTRQTGLAKGSGRARRFDPDFALFAATRDNDPESLEALAQIVGPKGDCVYLLQRDEIALPVSLRARLSAAGVLMIKRRDVPARISSHEIVRLGDADAPDMRALADLTKPGPFRNRTHELGTFWGIRTDGCLAAMAGERLTFDGFTEVSGVCTHPDFQGQGLAAILSQKVAETITARGDTPFLHAFASNEPAIRLYRKLGFDHACDVHVAVAERRG